MSLLGKQASIANYFRHMINMLELNEVDLNRKRMFGISMKNTQICIDCGARST